jgi:hypothetical protein
MNKFAKRGVVFDLVPADTPSTPSDGKPRCLENCEAAPLPINMRNNLRKYMKNYRPGKPKARTCSKLCPKGYIKAFGS